MQERDACEFVSECIYLLSQGQLHNLRLLNFKLQAADLNITLKSCI